MSERINQSDFPRITLKCNLCDNEFQINVLKFRDKVPINCQVCGNEFSVSTGEKFANALQNLYEVKYELDKNPDSFQFSFVYKSSYTQPPVPYSFSQE